MRVELPIREPATAGTTTALISRKDIDMEMGKRGSRFVSGWGWVGEGSGPHRN